MIYIEVEKSSDRWALGFYEFEFNQITIGRSKRNDLIFNDSELPLNFLSIKFLQDVLVVQSSTRIPFFFVNGKKVSGTLKIKENDVIAFGENQLRIKKAQFTSEAIDFSLAYEEFNKKAPELKIALETIEEILIDLEKDSSV